MAFNVLTKSKTNYKVPTVQHTVTKKEASFSYNCVNISSKNLQVVICLYCILVLEFKDAKDKQVQTLGIVHYFLSFVLLSKLFYYLKFHYPIQ
jgi:hypothetical protein